MVKLHFGVYFFFSSFYSIIFLVGFALLCAECTKTELKLRMENLLPLARLVTIKNHFHFANFVFLGMLSGWVELS